MFSHLFCKIFLAISTLSGSSQAVGSKAWSYKHLKVNRDYVGFPNVSNEEKLAVGKATKMLMLQRWGVNRYSELTPEVFNNNIWDSIRFFANSLLVHSPLSDKMRTLRERAILGRLDVLVVPAAIDYDALWRPVPRGNVLSKSEFGVYHAAAPELSSEREFRTYFMLPNGHLDVQKYLDVIHDQIFNVFSTAVYQGLDEFMMFPYGMGAFLRNLHKHDPVYADKEESFKLRESVAMAMLTAMYNVKGIADRKGLKFPKVFFNLPMNRSPKFRGFDETNYNFNAFISGLQSSFWSHTGIEYAINVNTDAFEFAAQRSAAGKKVALLNGANNLKIGNHWYENGAFVAIDENIHRRSSDLAVSALGFNYYCEVIAKRKRPMTCLQEFVDKYQGTVILSSDLLK